MDLMQKYVQTMLEYNNQKEETEELFSDIFESESISDIIYFNIDIEGVSNMLKFNGTNEIILYAGLNKTNAEKLKQGQHTKMLIAQEYYELARKTKEAEVVVEIAYDTKGLFDMLHPSAFNLVAKHIKDKKLVKSEIKDMQIITDILNSKEYTGVRAAKIDAGSKCYPKTQTLFEGTMLLYFLNPANVKVINTTEI